MDVTKREQYVADQLMYDFIQTQRKRLFDEAEPLVLRQLAYVVQEEEAEAVSVTFRTEDFEGDADVGYFLTRTPDITLGDGMTVEWEGDDLPEDLVDYLNASHYMYASSTLTIDFATMTAVFRQTGD